MKMSLPDLVFSGGACNAGASITGYGIAFMRNPMGITEVINQASKIEAGITTDTID